MSYIVKTKNGQYLVTIPVKLCKALDINHSTKVRWTIRNKKEIIMKIEADNDGEKI